MREINRFVIPHRCHSLVWSGDELIDWVGGGTRIPLHGNIRPSRVAYRYRFDQAIVSPSQKYVALYERLGTKGLLLTQEGKILREINRSFYYANLYEYPLTFVTLPDGRTGIVHCPHSYGRLEIEEVETGESLTQREAASLDFFHSRLAVSADNRYLLNAGWVWGSTEMIQVYDLPHVYSQPVVLDTSNKRFWKLIRVGVEITNAAFLGTDAVVFTTGDVNYDPEEVEEEERERLEPQEIAVYELTTQRLRSHAPLSEPAGMLMPVNEDLVMGFYEHPKLIEVKTGKVLLRWPDIESGNDESRLMSPKPLLIALDAPKKRFAVASSEAIRIIELG